MTNTTAIIVSYNTPELMQSCYESLRRHYPYMKAILVDGSPKLSKCWKYVGTRSPKINTVRSIGFNIGHGNGMKLGIELCQTEYFLLMDSDVTIDKPGVLESMHEGMADGVYGTGSIQLVNDKGMNDEAGFPYLHPHFALVNKSEYLKYPEIINHGAPMLSAMLANPNIVPFPVSDYITHHERGTRKLNPKAFHPKNWDKIQ